MCAAGLLIAGGCSTTPKIDWASRVGNYTYDQAVTEMGPPANSAKLTDGTMVADWLTWRGRSHSYITSGYSSGYYYPGPMWQSYSTTTGPDYYMRLTFGPNGQLNAWKKVVK